MSFPYRAEIDGLRAVAVVPVVLFHAGLDALAGGFVGVDVFFVISGYLITTILISEMRRGDFSIAAFYERRARRLLPALFLVIAACVPFAWLWMTPDQLRDFARSIVAVTLFSSNVLFWLESGYFSSAAELKPLLHTWSLSVEEQFYLLFPLALLLLHRLRNAALMLVFAVAALASLSLTQLGGHLQSGAWQNEAPRWLAVPDYAFYLAPTRAWELLVGVLAALGAHRVDRDARYAGALALTGAALIGVAVFTFDAGTPFPSVYTLVPVAGTALIILWGSPRTLVGRLLSTPTLVGIGLLSYSIYLWHQPLFAFARLRSIEEPGVLLLSTLGAASVVLAWLTWRFVEQPFRHRARFSRRRVFELSAATMVILLGIGMTGHLTRGFEGRFDAEIATLRPPEHGEGACRNTLALRRGDTASLCQLGADDAAPSVAVLGDSHAASLTRALDAAAARAGLAIVPVNDNWCAPLYGFGTDEPARNPHCRGMMRHAIDWLAARPEIETVVLVAEWANYTTGTRWGFEQAAAYSDFESAEIHPALNAQVFERSLARTLDRLADKRVIVVKSVPEYPTRVPDTLAKAVLFADGDLPPALKVDRRRYQARNAAVEHAWTRVADGQVQFVDSVQIFCPDPDDWCRYAGPDGVWYQDDNHLSRVGAAHVVEPVLRMVRAAQGLPVAITLGSGR